MQHKHLALRQNHMATTFSFTVSVAEERLKHANSVLQDCHRVVAGIERELSEFIPSSAVARLNNSQPGTRIAAPASLLEILELSEDLRVRTKGAFNCMAKSKGIRGDEAILEWDSMRGEVWSLREGAHLGFGAIGKGFALDEVRRRLEREGFTDYILDAGGSSILLSGFAAPEEPWHWAWSWRRDGEGNLLGLELSHPTGESVALGVSGTMEKGKHLIDPRTGSPVTELNSALVGHSSAANADALSTALYVLGWEDGAKLVPDSLNEPAIAIIDQADIPAWNAKFQKLWGAPAMVAAFALFFILSGVRAFADSGQGQAVDLSSLGLSTFTPYITERNSWWILLPVAILFIVMGHLPFSWNRKKAKKTH